MKKMLAFLFVLASILTLSSCGNNTEPVDNSTAITSATATPDHTTSVTPPLDVTENNSSQNIHGQIINTAYNYSEGYSFVMLNDFGNPWLCIDKKGNIVFELPSTDYTPCTGFCNGLAVMSGNFGNKVLCNLNGEIITAEELGGTSFILPSSSDDTDHCYQMFKDNYILMEKTTTDFTGSKTELAIVDKNFNTVLNYSEEFYNLYTTKYKSQRRYQYYDGYLYDTNEYINLKTGKETTTGDFSEFYTGISIKNKSDFWYNHENKIYDSKDGAIVMDLTQYSETLSSTVKFKNGIAPLVFESYSGNGINCYFTLIDEAGNFKFEPLQLEWGTRLNGGLSYELFESNGKYLLKTAKTPVSYSYAIFDTSGLLIKSTESMDTIDIKGFSDNVIRAYDTGSNRNVFYTLDFQPLL